MKKNTTSFIKLYVIVISIFTVSACSGFAEMGDEPTIVKTFTLDQPGSLFVKTSGGKIVVEGKDGNHVEVQAFIRKNGKLLSPDDPIVTDIYDGFDFKIEMDGSEITAYAKKLNNGLPWKMISVSFYVQIPHEVSCDLNTSGGSIKLSDVIGMHNVNTSGGAIHLNNITGKTRAHTSGGGIKVENQNGTIDLNTSGGRISVTGGQGNIRAHTSGGGIHLDNVNGEVDVNTSGGRIEIDGAVNYVKANTSGGGISVNTSKLDKEMHLETSGGGIDVSMPKDLGLDLDLSANRVHIDFQNFSGTMKDNKVQGTMNGGGIPVYMHTSGGNIHVNFQ